MGENINTVHFLAKLREVTACFLENLIRDKCFVDHDIQVVVDSLTVLLFVQLQS